MWYIQNYRPSNSSIILFCILLIISIYITIYESRFLISFVKNQSESNYNYNKGLSNAYFHVNLDLTKNTAKCSSNDILIIYILSKINHFHRRKIIRSTWASPLDNTCFVFILGKSPNSFIDQSRANAEKLQYKDIVQINHDESYENVIYKEVAALVWSNKFYPLIPYLFKTDDDLIVDSLLLLNIVRILITNRPEENSYISKHRPTLIADIKTTDRSIFFRGGWATASQRTLRGGGTFGVKESIWPHPVLPLYCSGFGWFMSNIVRNRLLNASYTYPVEKIVWIGDVFLSGFIAKTANLSCMGISIDYEQTSSANCSCLMMDRPMLTVCSSGYHSGGGSNTASSRYNEYAKAWKVIQQRHGVINTVGKTC